MRRTETDRWLGTLGVLLLGAVCALASSRPAAALDVSGTITFEGSVSFAAPIAGIALDDLEIGVGPQIESTGGGEKCSIQSLSIDTPDLDGTYPGAAGTVSVDILIEKGGPQVPDNDCILVLRANATDGVSVSARGTALVFVSAAEVGANATVVVPPFTVLESKAVAGVDTDCLRFVRRHLAKRRKCNDLLLRKGTEGQEKCDTNLDVTAEEPVDCDPGNFTEEILALSFGGNDQQTAPGAAVAIDLPLLKPQLACQRKFSSAARAYAAKRSLRIQKRCVETDLDSEACRETEGAASRRPLDRIDRCAADQVLDGLSGKSVPDAGSPCDFCIDGAGLIDRKCLKGCFELVVNELTDGIVGDVATCGNGILQPGEVCDDANLVANDCCSASCTAEDLGNQTCGAGICEVTVAACLAGEPVVCTPGPAEVEGPDGDPSCLDGLDNDCDGLVDAADMDCLP